MRHAGQPGTRVASQLTRTVDRAPARCASDAWPVPSGMATARVKPWMLVSAIWIWPAVFGVVNRVAQGRLQGWGPASPAELLFEFWDWIAYALVTPAIFAATARWPVIGPRLRQHFLVHLGLALLFCVVWAVVGKVLQLVIMSALEPDTVSRAMANAGAKLVQVAARDVLSWVLTTIPFGVVVYATVAGLASAITYFTQARDREVQLARLSEQLSTARFSALQAHVNPHFLFNTLNTVAVLIRDGERAGAVRMVELLSDVLRRTLRREQADETTLTEELALVRQYAAIEVARFPDRLHVAFDVAAEVAHAAVPAFAIQHLVENAIRHGIAPGEHAGRVHVRAAREGDHLVVMVDDDGVGRTDTAFPAGHGLANTAERLQILHGASASLDVRPGPTGGTRATLRVPLRLLPPMVDRDAD